MGLFSFFKKQKNDTPQPSPYPDITEAGGITPALDNALQNIQSAYRCVPEELVMHLAMPMAIASYGNRFVQVYMKRERRLYLFEFWQNGLCLAEGYISHLVPVAQTIDLWLSSECSPDDLVDQFPFIAPYDNSTFKEAAKQVEKRWDFYCSDGEFPELQTFFHLAAQDEVLSQLCPYTSLYTLRFSRCAEFPFDSEGMPDVTPKAYENYAFSLEKSKAQAITLPPDEGEIFVVIINRTQYVGEGNATTALQLVKSLLPPGIKPIRKHGQQ